MVNLMDFGDLYARGTASSYNDYTNSRAKIFFAGFIILVSIIFILGFITSFFKKTSAKRVEPPMPSNNRIRANIR